MGVPVRNNLRLASYRREVIFLIAKHGFGALRFRVLEIVRLINNHQIPCARSEKLGVLAENIVIDDNDVIVCGPVGWLSWNQQL